MSTDSYVATHTREGVGSGGRRKRGGAAVVGRGIDSTVGVAEVDTGVLSSNVRFLDPFEGERLSRKSSALPDNDNGAFCS